jgi:septal ring factor EnvC (AmiA/AmiB activator)
MKKIIVSVVLLLASSALYASEKNAQELNNIAAKIEALENKFNSTSQETKKSINSLLLQMNNKYSNLNMRLEKIEKNPAKITNRYGMLSPDPKWGKWVVGGVGMLCGTWLFGKWIESKKRP